MNRLNLQRLLISVTLKKDFGKCRFDDHKSSQVSVERICWKLFFINDDVGTLILISYLKQRGYSWCNKGININEFYLSQFDIRLSRLLRKRHKSALELYFIGNELFTGAKIVRSLPLARKSFSLAFIKGHSAAIHEKSMATILEEEIEVKSVLIERIRPFGIAIKDTINAIELNNSFDNIGTKITANAISIKRLILASRNSIYSDYGKRFFNVKIEKIFKDSVKTLVVENTNSSIFTLGMIAENSRANPTGKKSSVWYREGALRGHIPCALQWISDVNIEDSQNFKKDILLSIFGDLPIQVVDEFKKTVSYDNENEDGE